MILKNKRIFSQFGIDEEDLKSSKLTEKEFLKTMGFDNDFKIQLAEAFLEYQQLTKVRYITEGTKINLLDFVDTMHN